MGLNSSMAICECASASRKAARNIHQTIGATVRGCDGWKASSSPIESTLASHIAQPRTLSDDELMNSSLGMGRGEPIEWKMVHRAALALL